TINLRPYLKLRGSHEGYMYKGFKDELDEMRSSFDSLAYERITFGQGDAIIRLQGLQAALLLWAAENDVVVYSALPKQIKKVFTGNGNSSKEIVRSKVNEVFNLTLDKKDENASDAVAIAYTG